MELVNDLTDQKAQLTKDSIEKILVSLSIMAPHMASELLEQLISKPLYLCQWPSYDPVLLTVDKVTMVVQVNGKLRGNITIKHGSSEDEVENAAQEVVLKWLDGKTIVKVIVVANKLVNFVVK